MVLSTRALLGGAVTALFVTAPAGLVLLPALTDSPEQLAAKWSSKLAPEEIDHVVNQIQQYPVAHQKALYGVLSPSQKAQLWRARVSSYIETHPRLSVSAVQTLGEVMKSLSPDVFSLEPAAARELMAPLASRVRQELGAQATADLFVTLSTPAPKKLSEVNLPWLQELARSYFVVSARTIDCECNEEYNCPGTSLNCRSNPADNCTPTESGCGFLFLHACTGLCSA